MNRRNFLKLIPSAIIGLTIAPKITPIFTEPVSIGPNGEFVYWMIVHSQMYTLENPRACGIIENIEWTEWTNDLGESIKIFTTDIGEK